MTFAGVSWYLLGLAMYGLSLVGLDSCLFYMSHYSAMCPGHVLQMVDARYIRGQAQPCRDIYIFWSNLANLMSSHILLSKKVDLGHPKSGSKEVFTTTSEVMIRTGREERIVSK